MKTTETLDIIEKLPAKHKKAIISLVELVSEKETERLLTELDKINVTIDFQIEAGLERNEHELDILKSRYEKVTIKYNVLIGAISLIAVMIGILKFLE